MKKDRLKLLVYADSYNERVGQSLAYVNFLSRFGEVVMITAQNTPEFFVELGDVLVLPGGADVNPARYGETPFYDLTRGNWNYEHMDTTLLPMWIETGKPIIGICRGLQTLNVALGGTLFQHIKNHQGGNDRQEKLHPLGSIFPHFNGLKVNSFHHQAIKKLAPEFNVVGWSPVYMGCPTLWNEEDEQYTPIRQFRDKKGKVDSWRSIPEVIVSRERPYVAFQYHPEEIDCPLAIDLITEVLTGYYPNQSSNFKQYAKKETEHKRKDATTIEL